MLFMQIAPNKGIYQALKGLLRQGTQVGMREALANMFPGAQTFINPVLTFFDKLKQFHAARPTQRTDANTLDRREFIQEVNLLRKSFAVSWNPLHYLWAFTKELFGAAKAEDGRVRELERFASLANLPFGPEMFAVEACEALIDIINQRRKRKQGFISRQISPNKLAGDAVLSAAQNALKTWLAKVGSLHQLKILSNRLNYAEPAFIANDVGAEARSLVNQAERAIAGQEVRNYGSSREGARAMHSPSGGGMMPQFA